MLVDLLGILEDGSTPSRGLPERTGRTILVPRGTDLVLRLLVVTRAGVRVDLAPVDATNKGEVTFRRAPVEDPLLQLAGVISQADGAGVYRFAVAPSDWRRLDPLGAGARVLFDAWITKAGKRDPVVEPSTLVVQPSIVAVP